MRSFILRQPRLFVLDNQILLRLLMSLKLVHVIQCQQSSQLFLHSLLKHKISQNTRYSKTSYFVLIQLVIYDINYMLTTSRYLTFAHETSASSSAELNTQVLIKLSSKLCNFFTEFNSKHRSQNGLGTSASYFRKMVFKNCL